MFLQVILEYSSNYVLSLTRIHFFLEKKYIDIIMKFH